MGVPNVYWAGTPNYNSGNAGRLFLFPHWTCGGFDGSVATLQNPNREASAHYVIEGTKCAQLVDESNTAWHCGNGWYNWRSIGYELVGWPGNPPSYETLDTCARLMAQASRKYFGGAKLVHGVNVILHREVSSTDCPGTTDIDWLIRKANDYLGYGDSWPLQAYHSNGTDAQKFRARANGDGTYTFECAANGLVLDIAGAKVDGGTLQLHKANATAAQKFKLVRKVEASKGVPYSPADFAPYEIVSAVDDDYVLDLAGGKDADGTRLQCYKRNGSHAQEWFVLDNGDGTWTFLCNNAGYKKVIDAVGGGK